MSRIDTTQAERNKRFCDEIKADDLKIMMIKGIEPAVLEDFYKVPGDTPPEKLGNLLATKEKWEKHEAARLKAQKTYTEKNREKLTAKNLKWQKENPEKVRKYQNNRYKNDAEFREKEKKRMAAYTEANAETIKERAKEYYLQNREKIIARAKQHYINKRDSK